MRNVLVAFITCVALAACSDEGVSRAVGARCDQSADCEERCLTSSNDYPDGFCSLDCSSSSQCPSDAECADKDGGVCLFACFDERDCAFLGPTWTCREQNLRADQNVKVRVCLGI